jgi:proline iminopeptidase
MLKELEVKKQIQNQPKNSFWKFLLGICVLVLLSECEPPNPQVSEGYLDVNGSEIYYKTIGKGEPLIIVHGGPVLDHSYLLPHLESLAKDFQLVFYDQRATGRSSIDVDTSRMNLNAFIDDIELLRLGLGFSKINVLGHSWGGLLAMGYGAKYSQNIDHLVLSNSMASNSNDWHIESAEVANMQTEQDRFERQRILDGLKDENQVRLVLINELLMASFKPQMFDRSNLDKLSLNLPENYEQRGQIYQLLGPDMMSFNFDPELDEIKCPTLILYGDMEPAVKLYADKMVELIPNSELIVINKSGHFPFIEQPTAFDKAVLNFLNN